MATNPPLTTTLTPLVGRPRTLREQLTTFHLVFVALDPYVRSQRAMGPTTRRILANFEQADCHVATVMCGDEEQSRVAFGSLVDEFVCFLDKDRTVVSAFGLSKLPAFVHLGQDGGIVGVSEGWDPSQWQAIANNLGKMMHWSAPVIPLHGDPAPFAGSPAA